jgi:hypothetical protein
MDLTTICRELSTGDLCLRSPMLTDAEDMFAMLSDVGTVKYWSNQPATEIGETVEKLKVKMDSGSRPERRSTSTREIRLPGPDPGSTCSSNNR